jgi:hypothetical protein
MAPALNARWFAAWAAVYCPSVSTRTTLRCIDVY